MCPEPGLLSSYVDNEVPSPWKERLASHLEVCPACAAKVSAFRQLSAQLAGDGPEAQALARIEARLSARLGSRLDEGPSTALKAQGQKAGVFHRGLYLPLPLAAAAALALVFFMGMYASSLFRPPATSTVQNLATTEIAPSSTTPATMDALVHYLEAQNAQVNLTIQLPSGATFDSAGKPVVLRADTAAYSPSSSEPSTIMVPLSSGSAP